MLHPILIFTVLVLCLFVPVHADTQLISSVVYFWNETNITTLNSTANNASQISYDAGEDAYIMHVPFYQNDSTGAFTFNKNVYLKSNNDGNEAYYRFTNTTFISGYKITSWDTVSGAVAPETDSTRAYVYSTDLHSDIENFNFSYLGDDGALIRRYGIYIEGAKNKVIRNNTFCYNGRALYLHDGASHIVTENNTIENNTFLNNDISGTISLLLNKGKSLLCIPWAKKFLIEFIFFNPDNISFEKEFGKN